MSLGPGGAVTVTVVMHVPASAPPSFEAGS